MARIGIRSRRREGDAEPQRSDASDSYFAQPDHGDEPRHDEWIFLAQGSEDDWARLVAYTEHVDFKVGETVIKAGETDRSLYFLTEGRMDLTLPQKNGGERLVRTISAPSVVGEMGFIENRPRSMTIKGMTDGKLLRLDYEAFERLAAEQPAMAKNLLFELARVLSLRLRWATQAMSCGWQ
jgi:CRP/FNR family cyclic AMP-dependent transcriptional regulator